jgi:hypothetical protein
VVKKADADLGGKEKKRTASQKYTLKKRYHTKKLYF